MFSIKEGREFVPRSMPFELVYPGCISRTAFKYDVG